MQVQDFLDDQKEKIFNIFEKIEKDEEYRKIVNEQLGTIFALVDMKRKVIIKQSNNCRQLRNKALCYDRKYKGDWYPYVLPTYNWVNFYEIEKYFGIEDFNIMLDLCYRYIFKGKWNNGVMFPLNYKTINDEEYRTVFGQMKDASIEYRDFINHYNFVEMDDGDDKFMECIENSEIANLYSNDIDLNFDKYLGEFIEVKIMDKNIKIPLNWKTFTTMYKTINYLNMEIDVKNDIGIHISDIIINAIKNNNKEA